MFDFYDYGMPYSGNEKAPTYQFIKDGQIVGEFTSEVRSPVDQAEDYRNEHHEGADIYVKVTERSECPVCGEDKEETEEVKS